MKKEGFRGLFNSQDGKVNLSLLVSIVLIFVLMIMSAEAITITLFTPGNLTYNGSRNLNFTFNVTWGGAGDSPTNCSLWINSTVSGALTWTQVKLNTSTSFGGNAGDDFVANLSVSYMNYTLNTTSNGNFSWNVGCFASPTGALTFGQRNDTFFIDSVAPQISLGGPVGSQGQFGGLLGDATEYNITGYDSAAFNITVIDNSTQSVWMILNSMAYINSGLQSLSPFGTNESVNRSMTAGTSFALDTQSYIFNLSGIFNFNSSFTSPGPHSVIFCANDSLGRITCSNRSDFLIKGMNVTQMENMFSTSLPQGSGGLAFGGLNITFGNGTEIPTSTFMNPINGVNYGGITHKNFTFIFNFSQNAIVWVVGGSIDENQFANASNSRVNNTPTVEVRKQAGTGYSANMAWADIRSFIPSQVSYLYGIIQIGGVGYSKRMYCNGTSMSDPQCHLINQCNATVFGIYNYTSGQTSSSPGVIPANDGCWLESGTINGQSLTSGYTYIFVSHFSGGLGAADFSQINVTYNSPLFDGFNTTIASRLINITLDDTNSTGLNLTANFSINVTLTLGGGVVAQFNYINSGLTNLTCNSADTVSPQNTTEIFCNVTYAFSNGTYLINVTARDASNNSNPVNVSTSSITIIVDQIPPALRYFNITNSSAFNTSGTSDGTVRTFDTTSGGSAAQGDTNRGTIFALANFTDNLTNVFQGALQFFNLTSGSWQTVNSTPVGLVLFNTSNFANFSFPIPQGHNEFEGQNVSFRIIANDTVGNFNNSIKNITIQINDTTKPTLLVSSVGGIDVANLSNTTNTKPTVVYNVTEPNDLKYIAIQVDSLIDDLCGFKNYSTRLSANANKNGSLAIFSLSGCPSLSNGTHTVRLTSADLWGNSELYIHQFVVNTQEGGPNITLAALQNRLSAMNQSNVTPYTGINFTVMEIGASAVKNITFTSSCNSTEQTDGNATFIYPFNYTSCKGAEANQTVTIKSFDFAGNSQTLLFQFAVDDVAPTIAVHSPTDGANIPGIVSVNVSALDSMNRIDTIGYFLDGIPTLLNHTINGSRLTVGQGQNTSIINRTINFTPGTHTIVISVNDTLGNAINSSPITFTQTGPITFLSVNNSMEAYATKVFNNNLTNVSIQIKTAAGDYQNIVATNETSTNTFQILYQINGTINVSLTDINGSAINWDKINFTPYINQTSFVSGLQNNWTNTILQSVWFNTSIGEFTNNNNNSYYGVVVLPLNLSGVTATAQELWWIPNEAVLSSRTNISQCTGAFSTTSTTPCWNYTSGGRTIIQVPHFSIVIAVNDSGAPTITVNKPDANQTVSMFIPNITVSTDTVNCKYLINGSTSNTTMTQTGTQCIGQTESFKNLNAVVGYNITFFATDAAGNIQTGIFLFNVSDTTAPLSGDVSSSPSTTTATVTITGANETVNATVKYGTVNTTLSSSATETDFATTQTVSLSSLTASTTYYFNVTICDYNGNCLGNGTFSFTTSAAASTTTTTTSSSSGGGGSAAGAETTTTTAGTAASASRQWDSIEAGSEGTLTIHNADIAVTGVTIDVANTVSNPSITVSSYSSNPLSTEAAAKVYQYLEIKNYNLADTDISKVTVSFAVTKSWLTSNGLGDSDIVLWRYSSSQWSRLETKMASSDASYVYYEAVTPGFSTFAIGNKEGGGTSAFVIIDMIRDFYAGTSKLTAFDVIDQIRVFYGG